MKPAITIESLSKKYKLRQGAPYLALRDIISKPFRTPGKEANSSFWALKDLDLEVGEGERVGIIGANGAGKSTLLKIISRITPPTTGRVLLNGRVASLLEVGTGFHPELTGRENIYLNGSILGLRKKEIDAKLDAIIDFSGVATFIDTPLKNYSSGMQLRLAFAVAAHLEPEILLIDEVLAVGDIEFQKKCIGKMEEISRSSGRTILFVSHNLAAIRSLCSRCVYLKKGTLLADGPVGDVLDRYIQESLQSSPNETSIEDMERYSNKPEQAKISSISFNGGGPVYHQGQLQITMTVHALQPVQNCVAAVGFVTAEGAQVLLFDTDNNLSEQKIFSLEAGHSYVVQMEIAGCDLQPGSYFINAALRSNNAEQVYDLVKNCMLVDVLPGEHTPAVFANTTYQGGVRPPVNWQIKQL